MYRYVYFAIIYSCTALPASSAYSQNAAPEPDLHIQQVEVAATQRSPEEVAEDILYRLQHGGIMPDRLDVLGAFSQGQSFAHINQHGQMNAASLSQSGLHNLAVMQQEGNSNTTVLEQIGNGNVLGVWLTGDNNFLDVLQQGNDNVYVLDFIGDDLQHTVTQQGDGIQARQIGLGSRPFGIEQYGSGLNILIEHVHP